jgi:hypothetical protein
VTVDPVVVKMVILGAGCLGLSVFGWKVRRVNRERPLNGWRYFIALGAGIVGGLGAAVATWPFSSTVRVVGFPFPVAAFELSSSGLWRDFVGITSGPFFCLDAMLGGVLGYGAVRWYAQRRVPGESAAG